MATGWITSLLAFVVVTAVPTSHGYNSVGYARHVVEEIWRRYNASAGAPADLVFVLDRSGSVPQKVWISTINFVKVS
jgi:hypothetical protein